MLTVTQEILARFRQARQDFWSASFLMVLTKLDTSEGAWLDKAGNSVSCWTKWNPLGFYTFLRHEGAWKTASCGRANWNAQLLDAADELLRPDPDALCDISLTTFRTERLQTLSEAL